MERGGTIEVEALRTLLGPHEDRLRAYVRLLLEWNERVRLVGPSDEDTLWREHVCDCAATLPLLPASGRVLDLGSGGGLPGIVWAIVRPELDVVLCESIAKKAKALASMAESLGLENVRVAAERSEDMAIRERERFAALCARAVAHLGVVAEYAAPLVAVGGALLAMKGPAVVEEYAELRGGWGRLGFDEPEIWRYFLGEKERIVLRAAKCVPAPASVPRRPGMAERKPWWR